MANKQTFDLACVFTKNVNIFLYFGFWKVGQNFKHKILYRIYTASCFSILIFFLLPQFIYMIINSRDILKITGTMYIFCTFFVNLVKTFGIYSKMDEIKEILKNFKVNPLLQVKCPLHFSIARQMKSLGDYLFIYGSFLGVGTQVFWSLVPCFQEDRTLLTKGWYPYDAMSSPFFEATNFFQNVASSFNILHTMNIDSFTINLMMEVGMEFDFLKITLEHLSSFQTVNGVLDLRDNILHDSNSEFSDEMTKNLKTCIKHFVEIKRIASTIEDIYRLSILTLFLGGAFIFCTIFYQLLLIKTGSLEFFYLMFFLFSMLTEQFIFCWFGNEMTFKSSRVLHAVYNVPSWVSCDHKFRKMLRFFMLIVQNPTVIYAGRLIPLSIGVFINVLRTSYSYFTLLKKM